MDAGRAAMNGDYFTPGSGAPKLTPAQLEDASKKLLAQAKPITAEDPTLQKFVDYRNSRSNSNIKISYDTAAKAANAYDMMDSTRSLIAAGAPINPENINLLKIKNGVAEADWLNTKANPYQPEYISGAPKGKPIYSAMIPIEDPNGAFSNIHYHGGDVFNDKFVIPEFDPSMTTVTDNTFYKKGEYGLTGWLDPMEQHIDRAMALRGIRDAAGKMNDNRFDINYGEYEKWLVNNGYIKGQISVGSGEPFYGPYALVTGSDPNQIDKVLEYFGHTPKDNLLSK